MLHNRHPSSSKTFSSPQKEASVHWASFSQLLASTLPFLSLDFSALGISYKWNHTACDLLCLALFTSRHFAEVCVPFCGWMLLHCPSMFRVGRHHGSHSADADTQLVATFCPSWMVLLWTFVYKLLLEDLFSELLGVYLGVELLGHTNSQCSFLRNYQTVLQRLRPLYMLTSSMWGFRCLHSYQHLVFSLFYFKL